MTPDKVPNSRVTTSNPAEMMSPMAGPINPIPTATAPMRSEQVGDEQLEEGIQRWRHGLEDTAKCVTDGLLQPAPVR